MPQDGRRRRAYSLTASGREALQAWITSGEPLHSEMRHEGLLRFFFADVVDPDDQLELVRTMREMHERARDEMRASGPRPRRRAQSASRRSRSARSSSASPTRTS